MKQALTLDPTINNLYTGVKRQISLIIQSHVMYPEYRECKENKISRNETMSAIFIDSLDGREQE